ncbi:hypothetical protein [Helicobacter salomonis]|nr:hypothetical protein [Helicobacter salomonis]
MPLRALALHVAKERSIYPHSKLTIITLYVLLAGGGIIYGGHALYKLIL